MNGTIIALIPDEQYTSRRPNVKDPHLTLAMFDETDARMIEEIRMVAARVVGSIGPRWLKAQYGGTGVMDAITHFALVDLIDGDDVFEARMTLDYHLYNYGLSRKRDKTHGFTPHITREFVSYDEAAEWDKFSGYWPKRFDFKFKAVAVWARQGEEKLRWELPL